MSYFREAEELMELSTCRLDPHKIHRGDGLLHGLAGWEGDDWVAIRRGHDTGGAKTVVKTDSSALRAPSTSLPGSWKIFLHKLIQSWLLP